MGAMHADHHCSALSDDLGKLLRVGHFGCVAVSCSAQIPLPCFRTSTHTYGSPADAMVMGLLTARR